MYKHFFNRFFDFTITFVGLIVISPIFLVLCLLVRIKLGSPIFFKQVRITKDDKPFFIVKFRTMTDARDAEGNLLPDTERFTKFGDFLRNSSLDELPELFNVLKGDMSLIGPRPLYPFYLPYYTKEESLRHTVRAGITGLAQINGRNLCKWNDRFGMDVKYVKELSLVNDIKILWRTFFKVAAQEDIGTPSVDEELGLHIVRELQQPEKLDLLECMWKKINEKHSLPKSLFVPRIKEIGSFFWLNESEYVKLPKQFEASDEDIHQGILLSTCRSAIKEILNHVNCDRKVALVPTFTCHSVTQPFLEAGYQVEPYPVKSDLTIDVVSFEACVEEQKPSVVLLHSYFGFDTLKNVRELVPTLQNRGIIVIEDFTHSMLASFAPINATYNLGSIRKWYPVPDGAFVQGLDMVRPNIEDKELEKAKQQALLDKGKYMEDGSVEKALFMKEAKDAELLLDSRTMTYAMCNLSKSIVFSSDKESMIKKRRANYRAILGHIKDNDTFTVLFKEMNDTEVPYMFPILVKKDRMGFQKYLAEHSIYATIIWACPEELLEKVNADGQLIYNQILCIPIDQMYDNDDMQRIVYTINKYLNDEQ